MRKYCPACGGLLSHPGADESGVCEQCGKRFSGEGATNIPQPPLRPAAFDRNFPRPKNESGVTMRVLFGCAMGTGFVLNLRDLANPWVWVFAVAVLLIGYSVAGEYASNLGRRIALGILLAIGMAVLPMSMLYVGCSLVCGSSHSRI